MSVGDLTTKVEGVDVAGEILDLVNTINGMVDQLAVFAAEVTRVAREVGTEGRLGVQARVENMQGSWQAITYVSLWSDLGGGTDALMKCVREHHGVQLDFASARFRADLCRCDRRRLHPIHHCRGERRDGLAQNPDQSDGVQSPREHSEEYRRA